MGRSGRLLSSDLRRYCQDNRLPEWIKSVIDWSSGTVPPWTLIDEPDAWIGPDRSYCPHASMQRPVLHWNRNSLWWSFSIFRSVQCFPWLCLFATRSIMIDNRLERPIPPLTLFLLLCSLHFLSEKEEWRMEEGKSAKLLTLSPSEKRKERNSSRNHDILLISLDRLESSNATSFSPLLLAPDHSSPLLPILPFPSVVPTCSYWSIDVIHHHQGCKQLYQSR